MEVQAQRMSQSDPKIRFTTLSTTVITIMVNIFTFIFIYQIYVKDMAFKTQWSNLGLAFDFFDRNRDLLPIVAVEWTSEKTCSTGFSAMPIYQWPGSS